MTLIFGLQVIAIGFFLYMLGGAIFTSVQPRQRRAWLERPLRLPKASADEPIIGYRAWQVRDGLLAPQAADHPSVYEAWQPCQALAAMCMFGPSGRSGHVEAPQADCGCGYYAFKDMRTLRANFDGMRENLVIGRVALWGTVIEHENGYRAEYAYPQVLFIEGEPKDEAIRALAQMYGAEVIPLKGHDPAFLQQRAEAKRLWDKAQRDRNYGYVSRMPFIGGRPNG